MDTIRVGRDTDGFEVFGKISQGFNNGQHSFTLTSMGTGVLDLIRLVSNLKAQIQGLKAEYDTRLESMPSKKDPTKTVNMPILQATLSKTA